MVMGDLTRAALADSVGSLGSGVGARLRAAAKHFGRGSLSDGTWFQGLVAAHLAGERERARPQHWDRAYPALPVAERVQREVRKTALKAAATGAGAAPLTTSGELAPLFTEGLAGPIGVPAAVLSMVLEATYKALLQIDLVGDLAAIHGQPFGPGAAGEVTAVFATAV